MSGQRFVPNDRDRLLLWLEVTGRCNLRCVHCYSASGPEGDHGTMSGADWRRTIEEAAALGAERVQFIGGEPTLHPDLASLVRHALSCGLGVEVYSNLARPLPSELWELFELSGVCGRRRLWDLVETNWERFRRLGKPGMDRYVITVVPGQGQSIHLDGVGPDCLWEL